MIQGKQYSITMCSSLKCVLSDILHRCDTFRSFKQIHALAVTTGLVRNDHSVAETFVDYFAKFAAILDYACDFLKQSDWRSSSVAFNKLILGYSNSNVPRAGLLAYRKLVRDGFVPDKYTFTSVLKSCSNFHGVCEGLQVHGVALRMGMMSEVFIQNSFVHWYVVCGDCGGARKMFDEMLVRDSVVWTCLMSGCLRAGLFADVIALFLSMDVDPIQASFVSVLVACGRKGYISLGRGIHGVIVKRFEKTGLVLGNALVDMYVKCESLTEAKRVFRELPEKDVVSWNSLISGLAKRELAKEALDLFSEMQREGIEPDAIILTSVLSCCASIGALDYGKWVHEYVKHKGMKRDVHISTAMVDMYSKCGCLKTALKIFNETPVRNIVTWNALLNGMAIHGDADVAIKQFEEMKRSSARPNAVTFLALLTVCCHSGMVDEGKGYFRQMISEPYNIAPRLEHYGSMVDLLCRAGLLNEAQDLIATMPMKPDASIWGSFLSACNTEASSELSQEILDRLFELESRDSGIYVLLSNIYATNKNWSDVTRVRKAMKERGVRKSPGSSVIEVNGEAQEFLVGDTSHARYEEIRSLFTFLADQARVEACFQDHLL